MLRSSQKAQVDQLRKKGRNNSNRRYDDDDMVSGECMQFDLIAGSNEQT